MQCKSSPLTRGAIAAASEEAGQAKQVAQVVPRSVVVNLIDTEIILEQRDYKDEWRDKAMPHPEPEARNSVIFTRRASGGVGSRCASSNNEPE